MSAEKCAENGFVSFKGKCYLPAPAPPKKPAPTSSPEEWRQEPKKERKPRLTWAVLRRGSFSLPVSLPPLGFCFCLITVSIPAASTGVV
jgi:hypothetical protein